MYIILLITTAHRRSSTSLAVSDKGISKSLTICCNLQDWGLVCYEATRLMWSPKSCVAAAQCCCAHVVHWKVKVPSSLTDGSNCFSSKTSLKYAPFTFTPGCIKTKPVRQSEHGDTDWNLHAETCLSETSEGCHQWTEAATDWNMVSNRQPSLIKWLISGKVVLMHVLKPTAMFESSSNIWHDVFLRNCHDL